MKTPISSMWQHDDRYFHFQRVSGLPADYFRRNAWSKRAVAFWLFVAAWVVAAIVMIGGA